MENKDSVTSSILDRLNNTNFMDEWEKMEQEKHKKAMEEKQKAHDEYIDNFCEYRHLSNNLSQLDTEATFKKIAEEIWKLRQALNNKADREIRLGGY